MSSNTGLREQLVVDGVPVGRELDVARPSWAQPGPIVVVVATDAPLGPRQLSAREAQLPRAGPHRCSGPQRKRGLRNRLLHGRRVALDESLHTARELDNEVVSPLFDAVCEATAEAIWNALCAAEDFTGRAGNWAPALPHDDLVALLARHGRIQTQS